MSLCLFIHNHQPIGVSDEHVRRCYEEGWLPLLMMIRERKSLKVAMYNSGVVWNWLSDNGSDYLAVTKELLEQERLELIGGAAYEPLLPLITHEDVLGQTGRMSRMLQGLFDELPRGFWLAHQLWEPHLPTLLAQADVDYILSSNSLIPRTPPLGPLVVEDRGQTIRFLPIVDSLVNENTSVPAVGSAIKDWFQAVPEGLLLLGADLSIFAPQSKTDKALYPIEKVGVLLDLLVTLGDDGHKAALPVDVVENCPIERVWPCSASFGDDCSVGLRENMARRASVDSIYRKMLHVSRKIQFSGRPTPDIKEILARGQCGTAFLSGDATERHHRRALWRELLMAEDGIDAKLHGKGSWVDVDEVDFNGDGHIELLVGNRQINAYFAPNRGGSIFEIDFKPRAVNVLDNVLRFDSPFHGAFVDCFPIDINDAEAARDMTGSATGWDVFGSTETSIVSDRDMRISFTREGSVASPSETGVRVTLEKVFRFAADQAEFKVRYRLVNRGPGDLCHPFGVGFGIRAPLGGLSGETILVNRREIEGIGERGVSVERAQEITIDDNQIGFRTQIQFTMCSKLFLIPLAWPNDPCGTLALLPTWEGPLPEGEILELDVTVDFEYLEGGHA